MTGSSLRLRPAWAAVLVAMLMWACSDSPDDSAVEDQAFGDDLLQAPGPLYAASGWAADAWQPSWVLKTVDEPTRRGLIDARGIIHAHTAYSHDACDGKGFDDEGKLNEACVQDFRDDFCKVGHDFVMVTDHSSHFREHPFPDVLLYRPDKGDKLIERDGQPVANRLACADGRLPILMVGGETSASMPVGLEGHVPGGDAARDSAYGDKTPEAYAKLKAQGAVVLIAHTEDWEVEDLIKMPLDGFEMYNLHANMMARFAKAAELLGVALSKEPGVAPHPDLSLVPLIWEDERYLSRWGSVLAAGVKRVTTLGTDCHRNTLNFKIADDERIDSYRRMMQWFSNHLLLKPKADGGVNDRALKEALRSGRLYGVFEMLGYPDGFDFAAVLAGEDKANQVQEMGASVSLAKAPELRVRLPKLAHADPKAPAPELRARILRAIDGGWQEVASAADHLAFKPTETGAYRAEIRMIPRHLKPWLGSLAEVASQDYPWIYSNAIYVEQ